VAKSKKMDVQPARLLRFGDFELDVRPGELRKHGVRIRLQAQSIQILLMLLDRPGEVVLLDEIRQKLWPNNTIVEFDHSINAAIKRLRNALGESAEEPRYIETLSKRGYRFSGQVKDESNGRPKPALHPPTTVDSDDLNGKVFSNYKVLEKLGSGGMGVVYRAEDLKLGRQVALKFLQFPYDELSDSILQRFEREARAASALNHPNVCTVYNVDNFAGQPVIVMELVDGETLEARLQRGALTLVQAVTLAIQIADALSEAHGKGVVHRDLKPANIMIAKSGAKVLDFGLARIEHRVIDAHELAMTAKGTILGTVQYMSPEQAQGNDADARSDVFSFGLVLYEMIAGKRAFEGSNPASILAAILEREPPALEPEGLNRVVRACLAKDPADRFQSARDLKRAIEWGMPEVGSRAALESAPEPGGTRRRWLAWGAAAVLALALVTVAFLELRRSSQSGDTPLAHLTMELTPAEALSPDAFGRPSVNAIAITPDGNTVVFSALNPGAPIDTRILYPPVPSSFFKLYRRSLGQAESVAIPGTEGAIGPFLNSDAQWVGFWADGKLKKVSLNGGPPFTICDAKTPMFRGFWGASWSSTDTIVFGAYAADLMQVPAKGGTPQVFLRRDSAKGELYSTPEFLPDGKTLLYTVRTSENWADARIVARLDTGEQRVLIQGGTDARYVPTGHLLYMQNAVLMAAPFDTRRLQLAGAPVAMLDGVMQAVNEPNRGYETGMGQFAASASGNLIYAIGGIHPPYIKTLLRVDRNGKETELNAPRGVYGIPRVSPDGRRLAVFKYLEASRLPDIWVIDLVTGNGTRLTSQGTSQSPLWSPDGKRILFAGGPEFAQILSIAADGSGTAETVLTGKGQAFPASWSVDGKLAYLEKRDGKYQIFTRSMSRDGASEPFSDGKFNFHGAQLSPDGHWMAYVSDETGRNEVWVRAFPGPGEKYPISAGGGILPVWGRDQRELFYLVFEPSREVGMMAVHIAPGAAFKFGQPHRLFEGVYETSTPLRSYDITPDGRHFIMLRNEPWPDQRVTKLTVVLNWFDELRRRAPVGK
jgi:serine/threonine protein kinase